MFQENYGQLAATATEQLGVHTGTERCELAGEMSSCSSSSISRDIMLR